MVSTAELRLGLLRPPIHFDRLTVIKKTGQPVHHRLRCAHCHCTTCRFAGRPSLTAVGLSAVTAVALALISITCCSQAKFDTCQERTSSLHASQ